MSGYMANTSRAFAPDQARGGSAHCKAPISVGRQSCHESFRARRASTYMRDLPRTTSPLESLMRRILALLAVSLAACTNDTPRTSTALVRDSAGVRIVESHAPQWDDVTAATRGCPADRHRR